MPLGDVLHHHCQIERHRRCRVVSALLGQLRRPRQVGEDAGRNATPAFEAQARRVERGLGVPEPMLGRGTLEMTPVQPPDELVGVRDQPSPDLGERRRERLVAEPLPTKRLLDQLVEG